MVDAVAEEGDFLQAIERYTEAISLNRNNHLLFYNRSAAYARVGKFAEALEDAKRCLELKPDWPKVTLRERAFAKQCPYSSCVIRRIQSTHTHWFIIPLSSSNVALKYCISTESQLVRASYQCWQCVQMRVGGVNFTAGAEIWPGRLASRGSAL